MMCPIVGLKKIEILIYKKCYFMFKECNKNFLVQIHTRTYYVFWTRKQMTLYKISHYLRLNELKELAHEMVDCLYLF